MSQLNSIAREGRGGRDKNSGYYIMRVTKKLHHHRLLSSVHCPPIYELKGEEVGGRRRQKDNDAGIDVIIVKS